MTLEWKNPINLGENQKNMMKKLVHSITWFLKKIAYLSEMAINPVKSDFRSSKMATGSHFVKKNKSCVSEMARNAIENDFRSSKMVTGGHFVKENKSCVFIWND